MGAGRIDYSPSGTVAWFPLAAYGTARLGDRTVPRAVRVEIGGPGPDGTHNGAPMVRLHLEVIGDRPQCRSIEFVSIATVDDDGREVRQCDLDGFRLADWVERAFALAAYPGYESNEAFRADESRLRKLVAEARRPGSRKIDRAFLEQVAGVYRRNVNDRPTQTVAEAFGIAHSTAAEYVRRARAAGLLPPTRPGKRKA